MKQQSFLSFLVIIFLINHNHIFSIPRSMQKETNSEHEVSSASLNLNNDDNKNYDYSISFIISIVNDLIEKQQDFFNECRSYSFEHLSLLKDNLNDLVQISCIIQDCANNELESIQISQIQEVLKKEIQQLKNKNVFPTSQFRAPRPSAPPATANDAVVGKNVCDLTQVLALLSIIKKRIEQLQQIICEKFAGTFTVLEEIREDIFDTKTILCDKFNGTFTMLEEIEEDIFDTKTILCDKFNGTFTMLEEIEEDIFDTKTVLCDKFNGTFTVLEEICEKIEDLTFTVDLSGIFTVLENIKETLVEDVFDTKTILCDKFNGTFTVLEEICEKIEDLDITVTIENLTVTAVISIDISGVFTVLEEIQEDIFDTKTILCDKFNGTFTTLDFICEKIENLDEDFSGIFTAIANVDEDLFDTKTILCDKFNGTFTTLDFICEKIENLDEDFSGIFTAIANVDEDLFDTKTVLCDKFNSTFTVLAFICEKIEDNDDTTDNIAAALCTPTVIRQSNLGATTLSITTSGFYVFGENLSFSPGSGQPAISIETDDVVIDMCGKKLQQGNSTSGVDGFRIVGGPSGTPRSNVTIMNGAVTGFTRAGITVGTNSGSPTDTAANFVTLKNLDVVECEIRGIELLGSSGASITRSQIENCRIDTCCTDASADFGLHMLHVFDVSAIALAVSNNGALNVDLTGVNIETCTKCIFKEVTISCNEVQTFTGLAINGSMDSHLTNCQVITNSATNAFTGFVITGNIAATGNILTGCQVTNNISINGTLSGFELFPFVTRNTLQECNVSNNLVTAAVASANCFGFNLDQPTFCHLIVCNASNNQTTGDGSTNICTGFNIGTSGGGTTGTKNCEFLQNFAFKNNSFNDARSFGIRPVSLASGNVNNSYLRNVGLRNGPTTPVNENQIVADGGAGSNPGGVPTGSIRSRTISNLNSQQEELSNTRII